MTENTKNINEQQNNEQKFQHCPAISGFIIAAPMKMPGLQIPQNVAPAPQQIVGVCIRNKCRFWLEGQLENGEVVGECRFVVMSDQIMQVMRTIEELKQFALSSGILNKLSDIGEMEIPNFVKMFAGTVENEEEEVEEEEVEEEVEEEKKEELEKTEVEKG